MVKDVLITAMRMLGLTEYADALYAGNAECESELIGMYNLVVCEIAEEYRRDDYESPPVASSADDPEAEFFGISRRVLAYGVAAEYCITHGLDEAVTWDGRYKAALSLARRRRIRVPQRRMM